MSKARLKWSPAVPMKAQDKIISSKAIEKKQLGFKPSYENDPQEHIQLLLSNEYMRIWFNERAVYEKDTYTREKIIKEESKIKRRFVQRMMTYRKPTKNQFIEEMVEKRKKSTTSHQEQRISNYEKMKYKPECSKDIQTNKKNSASGEKENNTASGTKTDVNDKNVECNKDDQVFEVDIECCCK